MILKPGIYLYPSHGVDAEQPADHLEYAEFDDTNIPIGKNKGGQEKDPRKLPVFQFIVSVYKKQDGRHAEGTRQHTASFAAKKKNAKKNQ